MIENILVPLDQSMPAEAVLEYVKPIANATGARICLLAAVGEPRQWGEADVANLDVERQRALAYLESVPQTFPEELREKTDLKVMDESPAEAIIQHAASSNANLIAMTTHGRSGVTRWVLGSVADKVAHAAETPLLLVRPAGDGPRVTPVLDRMLIPLDGSESAQAVLPFAEDLARALGASIVLYHSVIEPVLGYPGAEAVVFDAHVLEEMESGARSFLETLGSALTAKGIRTETVVTVGNATDGIVWAAEREGADIIVMSTHGRSGLGRLVMGSVADAVVRRSSRPVVLVRPARSV